MSLERHKLCAFGDFRLDLDEEVLFRENTPINLTPKAFHLLKILVRNHGHIVDKHTLLSEIWGDTFVEDGNLAVNVALLRKVLGDDAAHPRYIETVARRGYRFIADVSQVSENDRSIVAEPKRGIIARPFVSQRVWAVLGMPMLIFASLTAASWYYSFWPFSRPEAPILSQPFRSEQLTTTGNAGSAAISSDGKYVAFTDRNNGKWSIWVRQLATSENIPIAPPTDEVYGGLVFSWDGNFLYFVRGEPGKRLDLYRVSAFGGVPVKLIETIEGRISISNDNQSISFVRCLYSSDDYCSLYVADIDGKNERRLLTRQKPFRIGDNQFSPDGRSVAFAAGNSGSGSSAFVLAKIDLESGRESEITPHKFFDINHLRWLPDGNDLLITARDKLVEKNSVWKVSAVTGAVTQITNDGIHYSKITLDEAARNSVVIRVDPDFKVCIASTDEPGSSNILTNGEYASFMPGGKIVYQSNDSDIWLMDVDSGEKRQLTNDPMSDFNPIISADGQHIFFTSNRFGANQVWRMTIDGGDQRPISSVEGGYPRFSTPDGKWVYYQSGLSNSFRKVSTDGSDEAAVPEIDGSTPAFSPNGQLIASFIRDEDDGGKLKIKVRNLMGDAAIRVLAYGDPNSKPVDLTWSHDNRTLYYVSESTGKYSLWRTSLDNEKPSFVAGLGTENLERFRISPDGRSILMIRGGWRHDAVLITGFH